MLITYGARRSGKTLEIIRKQTELLNQAVEDIRLLGRQGQFICPVCSRYDHGKGRVGECVKCLKGEDCFEWRGV